MGGKKLVLLAGLVGMIAILVIAALAAPPSTQNIKGNVYTNGSTQVPNGVPVRINNTALNVSVLTYTNGPPPSPGAYSTAINGSEGDNVTVTSWNATHYGINSSPLAKTTTTIHVILNITRSETNLSLNMSNNTVINMTQTFNFTINVSMIGGQNGIECSATLSINTSLISLTPGETYTHSLGNILPWQHVATSWNLTASASGSTNITANSSCNSDTINLDSLNRKTAYNITVADESAPVVSLESPSNNTRTKNNYVTFRYNVTDDSDMANCSLLISDVINQTNTSVVIGVSMNFTTTMPTGLFNWSVNCTDNGTSKKTGSSVAYLLNISPNIAPVITAVTIQQAVDLVPLSTAEIVCNATILDSNEDDTIQANATIYDQSVQFDSVDNNNSHYTNASCLNISTSGEMRNFTCRVKMLYFANNNTWLCNITAKDSGNATATSNQTFLVNELLSVSAASATIEYGNITVTQTSQAQLLNITNTGNVPINISVSGYGGDNQSLYENQSFWCPRGAIEIGLERFSISPDTFDQMHNLTKAPKEINMTLPKVTNQSNQTNSTATVYWRLRIPTGVAGMCNGTIVFIASLA